MPGGSAVTDLEQKCARLDAFLSARDLAAVWFARPASFAWLTGGDNVVDCAADVGVAAAGYDGETVRIVTADIEAPRLRAEELPDDVQVISFAWHTSSLSDAIADRSPRPAAADFDIPAFGRVDASQLRRPLTDTDVERYRELGRTTARTVERVCREISPAETERGVAADLRGQLAAEGIDAPVTLVGGERRAQEYRHYTPTGAELGRYALVSVTTTRDGLYASCTRTVAFDAPDWLDAHHDAATRVETTALAATRASGRRGGTARNVFTRIQDAYAALGYHDEWRQHHQGGAAGYAGREWIATPDASDALQLPMAYAWNPTVRGAKSEDTHLVTAEAIETLTSTGDWPMVRAEAAGFDVTLERPAVLRC